jgi:hypothetical protein
MSDAAVIFIVLFAGGTFLITLLEYIRKIIKENEKR